MSKSDTADSIEMIARVIGEPGNDDDLTLALRSVARAIRDLGNADASTPMGAIEALGLTLREGMTEIASGLHAVADALRERSG